MRKTRTRTVILTVLAILVIISLVGCVQLQQKKTDKEPVTKADKDADKADTDKKDLITPVDKEEKEELKEEEKEELKEEEKEELKEEEKEETPEKDGLPVKEVTEGDFVSFPNLKAVDPDGDPILYTFSEPLGANGTWQTITGDAGEYTLTITASDGKNKVTQQVMLIVHPKNQPPVITLASDLIEVDEGETVDLDVTITDPDGDNVTVTYEGWMTDTSKATTFSDAGDHLVTIIATDGIKESRELVKVKVNNINRAPQLDKISDVALTEGEKVTVKPVASDPDEDEITYTFSKPLNSNGEWATEEGDVGKYRVNVTVSDGDLTDTSNFFIVVESLNRPPVIELAQAEISVEEGDIVTISATITDPEEDELTITYSGWMTSNTYQTDYDDSGIHVVTLKVSDGINSASKDITVIVRDKNRPPVFDPGAFN